MMSNWFITFEWEGVTYRVNIEAYVTDLILLPDGRILQVNAWIETIPPKPKRLTVTDLASHANAVPASVSDD